MVDVGACMAVCDAALGGGADAGLGFLAERRARGRAELADLLAGELLRGRALRESLFDHLLNQRDFGLHGALRERFLELAEVELP
jgi:hypothetical protein